MGLLDAIFSSLDGTASDTDSLIAYSYFEDCKRAAAEEDRRNDYVSAMQRDDPDYDPDEHSIFSW